MRRSLTCVLVISLLMTLVCADATAAKKARSSRKAIRGVVKRESKHRGRVSRKVSPRGKRTRTRVVARGKGVRHLARSRRNRRPIQSSKSAIVSPAPRPTSSGISAERVTEIQNALIKAGYMEGPASGLYDESTVEAMKKFQAANRLRQTGLPSAPSLKKLGVSKRSNDGYAVPVSSVSEADKKPPPQ